MRRAKLLFVLFALLLTTVAYADRPPFIPSNSCEAHCLVEFRECDRICSQVQCLIACETLADLCLAQCATR